MPRRIDPKQQKRGWRWYVMIVINGLVVLSMVLGTFIFFLPPPQPAAPTIVPPTAAPIATPTPTPKAMSFGAPEFIAFLP